MADDELRGDGLRGWDERPDVAQALGKRLGIICDAPATLEIGGHHLQVCLEVELETQRWVLRVVANWPSTPARKTIALHEIFAMSVEGRLRKVAGPEAARWKLRMLSELGFIQLPTFPLPELPRGAHPTVQRVWNEITRLVSIRALTDAPGEAFPLSASWLSAWSGGTVSESQVRVAKRRLEDWGYLCRAGTHRGRGGGRPMILWQIASTDDKTATGATLL